MVFLSSEAGFVQTSGPRTDRNNPLSDSDSSTFKLQVWIKLLTTAEFGNSATNRLQTHSTISTGLLGDLGTLRRHQNQQNRLRLR
jgi:hypothetical protein